MRLALYLLHLPLVSLSGSLLMTRQRGQIQREGVKECKSGEKRRKKEMEQEVGRRGKERRKRGSERESRWGGT